jgi:diaminopimelate epimerase
LEVLSLLIEIIKCHGSGNDFLLIDEITHPYSFTEKQRAELALALCNRESKLGADGILFVMASESSDARMRVFNADGSEASMCGNGLRCVARYVCEMLNRDEAVIETMKANLRVKREEPIFPGIPTYKVEISPVSFQLSDLPLHLPQPTLINEQISTLSKELTFTALAVPNPHLVAIVGNEQLESSIQEEISQSVNRPNDLFPDGVNVSFVKPLEKGHIFVRTFERGVGFTNACGTAMSASALVTCLIGLNEIEESIDVYNPGGKVRCVVHQTGDTYTIDLIGNGTYLYKTKVRVPLENLAEFTVDEIQYFPEEYEHYAKLEVFAKEFVVKH